MNVVIRRLGAGDETLAVDVCSLFKRSPGSVSGAARFLANPQNYLIVAEVDGELAGFLAAYRLERLDRDDDQLFVYEVEVARDGYRPRRRSVKIEGADKDIAITLQKKSLYERARDTWKRIWD